MRPIRQVDTASIVALVLSVGWFFWIGSLVGMVIGYQRVAVIDDDPDARWGRPLATGAIAAGWIGLATLVVGVLYLALRLSFHYLID